MAETFIFSIAVKILWLLGSPVLQEIGFLWGLKDELQKLQNSISTIKAVLLDAEEKQTTNHEIRDWLEKIKDVFYEADDLLDDLSTEALKHRVKTQNEKTKQVLSLFSRSNKLHSLLKTSHKVKVIQKRLDAIAADRTFHLNERKKEIRVETRQREDHSFASVGKIIGRDEEKKNIIDLLLEPRTEENLTVISVVGIGGVGKTALAQLVYNEEKVKKHFELGIWVCVSHVFDVEIIARGIIESVSGKVCKKTRIDGVKDELKVQIDGKKFFLVLDDVWNEDPNLWLKLRELLTGGAEGSVILVTTRSQLVAKVMGTVAAALYILNGLPENASWLLFKQMAFADGMRCQTPSLIKVGKEIVRKCAGVPLAIRSVGSLLYIKDTEKEWLHFRDNKLSKIADTESSILSILKLSYDYLPPHLKRCFAYCSLFPKDYNIDKSVLIQLWIAQGLIQSSYEKDFLEDVGEQYFLDLLRRSFFQDVAKDELGSIASFKMHDLIHDLSEFVAGNESCLVGLDAKDVIARTHHVSIGFVLDSSWTIPSRLLCASQLRTLLLPIQKRKFYSSCMDKLTCREVISSFKCLRALDLHQLGMRSVPSSIVDLRRLRFLYLSFNYFRFLPKSICKLLNLQTLKLNSCHNLVELPPKIKNLVSLRHLELDGCMHLSSMPHGVEHLTSLRTLTRFILGPQSGSNHTAGMRELTSLVNLSGRLSIERLGGSIVETTSHQGSCFYVRHMEHLQVLMLKWESNQVGDYAHLMLFERLHPHRNLKKLQIENYGGVSFPSWANKVNIGFPSNFPVTCPMVLAI